MSIFKSSQYLTPPLARKKDPASSHHGANHVVSSGKLEGQCKQIYDALKKYPLHTPRELAEKTGIDYFLIQKRLSVLYKRGKAARRGERVCTVSRTGLPATQWEAVG